MASHPEDPGALAGAPREIATKHDCYVEAAINTASPAELQVAKLLQRFALSASLAVIIAELAFASRRPQ